MGRYQVFEAKEGANHAGSKAPDDVAAIADRMGFQRINIRYADRGTGIFLKINRQRMFCHDWRQCYNTIPEHAVVLLQHPIGYRQMTRDHVLRQLKAQKNVRFVTLIHDVWELRGFTQDKFARELQTILEISDHIIVHNNVMKEFFVQKGVPANRLVTLGIFDYLHSAPVGAKRFERRIVIAGNLSVDKSAYIADLNQVMGVNFTLYGPNFPEALADAGHVRYGGICTPEEIITRLDGGFGLVWDGDCIDTCSGDLGQYLRYNNPHKLSMYLSAGLPVVIWKGAAEAAFVEAAGVGILVSSLQELETVIAQITQEEYDAMCNRAAGIAGQLTQGFYTRTALEKCLADSSTSL